MADNTRTSSPLDGGRPPDSEVEAKLTEPEPAEKTLSDLADDLRSQLRDDQARRLKHLR